MNTKLKIAYLVMTVIVIAPGCGKNETDSKEAPGTKPEAKARAKAGRADVAALDKEGDEELASPNKAEARQWLRAPSHSVFKGDKKKVVQFVEEFYTAGAVTVYVTGIETLGGNEITASLLLVLPKDAAARSKVFAVANHANEEFDNDPEKDIGQKYLSFVLD